MNKNTLVEMLTNGTVELKFTKADNSVRVMNATLESNEVSLSNVGESISVLDTDLGEYRAFRFDSVVAVNGESVTVS